MFKLSGVRVLPRTTVKGATIKDTYQLYLSANDCVGGDIIDTNIFFGPGYCSPDELSEIGWVHAGIPLKVGAVISKITFYGILVAAADNMRFYVEQHDDITTGQPATTELYDSTEQTGAAGDVVCEWEPTGGQEILIKQPLVIAVKMYMEAATQNCRFKGCLIEYEE